MKILIIDDDKKLCGLIRDYLKPMGYDVDAAHNGADGLQKIQSDDFSAVILDVMMPGMDGFEVLKTLRKQSDIPVLMLTARGDETDRIVGLELGADDYLPKTFSTRELLARLRAVTRRSMDAKRRVEPAEEENEIMQIGDLRVRQQDRTVYLGMDPVNLTPVEFDLLVILAKATGRVLSRDYLLDAIAHRNYEVFDRSIDVHISSLRRKIGDDPREPRYIQTVRSAGYMFKDPGDKRK